jgi:glucose/arabinose dehydrogenase
LQFGPDGHLYLGTGDGGGAGDPNGNAQNPQSLLGKLLRIDPRKHGGHLSPSSNPFAHGGGRDEILALGLRNPFRFSFDARTGAIWIGDVGQDRREEIDTAGSGGLAGANFGWNIIEGDDQFTGGGAPPGYRPPALVYSSAPDSPNCAVTGGLVVRNAGLPSLDGRYLYADFCAGSLRSFNPSAPGPTDSAVGLDVEGPTSFAQGRGGRLYVSSLAGGVFRIAQR